MPRISWEEINDVIHKCKNTLTIAHNIEHLSKKMRKRLEGELKKIEDIILEQVKREENGLL